MPEERRRVQKFFDPKDDRTHQSGKDGADINLIVRRATELGQGPLVNTRPPRYGDFSQVTDYKEALDRVAEVEGRFYELPSEIRELGGNDPLEFMRRLELEEFREQVEEAYDGVFFPPEEAESGGTPTPDAAAAPKGAEAPEVAAETPKAENPA